MSEQPFDPLQSAKSKTAEWKAVIRLVGDSTMCAYQAEHTQREGWGMRLPAYCREGVEVCNHAISGTSTKSFEERGAWTQLLEEAAPGDFVVIGMGINDAAPKDTRPQNHTDLGGEFEGNLTRWIGELRERGTIPFLTTPTVIWAESGLAAPKPLRERYARAILATAESCRCGVVDLHGEAFRRLAAMSRSDAARLYLADRNDYCHLNRVGADFYAGLFAGLCKKTTHPIASLFA